MEIVNIIFDLGRVLIDWQPQRYMEEQFNKDLATFFWNNIFNSNEWNLMDKGEITEEELWSIFSKKYQHYIDYINHMKEKVPELLIPIQENVKLLAPLKNKGYKLYVLSNFSAANFEYVYNKFDFFRIFDGLVISSHVHSIKPELQIYRVLIDRFGINPTESLFVDDRIENVESAKLLKFNVIHLVHPEQLKNKLESILGCELQAENNNSNAIK